MVSLVSGWGDSWIYRISVDDIMTVGYIDAWIERAVVVVVSDFKAFYLR